MNPSEISALAARSGLDHVWRKVEAGERLSGDDATALLSSSDILALGAMADFARARVAGDEVYFISNRHINHTNVCRNRCLFCAFSHDEGDADAYTLSVDEVVEKARETLAVGGISEIHIVGGEHPDLPFELLPRHDARPARAGAGRPHPGVHGQRDRALRAHQRPVGAPRCCRSSRTPASGRCPAAAPRSSAAACAT